MKAKSAVIGLLEGGPPDGKSVCCREGLSALLEQLWYLEGCTLSLVQLRSGALAPHRPGAFPAVL